MHVWDLLSIGNWPAPSYVVLGARVVTDQPAVTWHLHKYNVQASVEKTQHCPADLQERYVYEPPRHE